MTWPSLAHFRDPALGKRLLGEIRRLAERLTEPITLMEFCGSHTHAIMHFGIRQLLPPQVRLLSGPGCPVCVTAQADIDRAIALASRPEVLLASFGDMLRVPGTTHSLQQAAAEGASVQVVYSPLDAVALAEQHPDREVVFLGVGFETTAPGVAAAVQWAQARGVRNFSVVSLHKFTPPAMRAILEAGEVRLDGIIGPGHVSAVIGSEAWAFLPREYGLPVAVAGFESVDILLAVRELARMVVEGRAEVVNAYPRAVRPEGNVAAQAVMQQTFAVADAEWRGFGVLPRSGMALREAFRPWDAWARFGVPDVPSREPPGCRCGEVLRGVLTPPECPLFGRVCTPEAPQGPCMVSAEGACAAWYGYGRAEEAPSAR
ncbi:MAG TPA: hydrogenase formation protein HypD [Chloroflexi bacterium]|nr:hydrogenase formation protein HypD [Chloroflexota bacterium]